MSLKKLLHNRKWLFVAVSVLLLVVLTGCTTSTTTLKTEDLLQGNFWERNVVYYFSLALDTFAGWFQGEYGLAILLLTIIVRSLILPLTVKQMRSSKEMQKLQPKLAEIKKKYGDNPQKQQEETMKLFQQHNVNPLAGCLPMIVQMPVFIALYNSIYLNSEIREHTFLWLKLGQTDPYYVLPIIAALTSFIQTKMMTAQQKGPNPMQFMLYVFPILIFVMSINFPAALPLYWVYSNLFTIVQNFFLYRNNDKEVSPAK
ncbi:membrane protein [Paenibacillus dendritiformis]|uniref:YidC/Oxa1 family membrane protein insertase n=1 Tax=Paenibacillus dendritiformis TaxID=130049 RepID=UPI0018CD3BC0|nr:YidC/Oxa1 family membrane protein insertase [Paenibacillus dendritiformis]MBG9794815.1 membrane protein [Paenibacillus dendritiformis]